MRAWTCRRYGGTEHLQLETLPRPLPKQNEVLVRVVATTVSSADWRLRTMSLPRGFGIFGRAAFGVFGPRQPIFGTEFSGVVEAVGPGVVSFAPGNEVVGFPGGAQGAHAEFLVFSAQKALALKPKSLSFEAAAALCFGGTTALHFLRIAQFRPGERVLVLGASGTVGSAFVQLARAQGAFVTGTTSSGNVALVTSLGAHEVFDYTQGEPLPRGKTFDIIADTVGASSFVKCLPLLNEHGRYLTIAGSLAELFTLSRGTKKSRGGPARENPEDVRELARLADEGAYMPLVDRVYPFSEMPAAHAHVATGRKKGSVVVRVSQSPDNG